MATPDKQPVDLEVLNSQISELSALCETPGCTKFASKYELLNKLLNFRASLKRPNVQTSSKVTDQSIFKSELH